MVQFRHLLAVKLVKIKCSKFKQFDSLKPYLSNVFGLKRFYCTKVIWQLVRLIIITVEPHISNLFEITDLVNSEFILCNHFLKPTTFMRNCNTTFAAALLLDLNRLIRHVIDCLVNAVAGGLGLRSQQIQISLLTASAHN